MKTKYLLIFYLFALSSCISHNEEIVRTFIDSYNNNQKQLIDSLLHENVKLHMKQGEALDKIDILKWYSYEMAISEKIEINDVKVQGNKVIVTQEYPDEIQKLLNFPVYKDIRTYFIENEKIIEIFQDTLSGELGLNKQRQEKWQLFFSWVNKKYPGKLEKLRENILINGPEYVLLVGEFAKETDYYNE